MGSFGGYKSLLAYDPRDGRTVVMLTNGDKPLDEMGTIATALFQAQDD